MEEQSVNKKKPDVVLGISKGRWPSWQQFKYLGNVLTYKQRWIIDICVLSIITALIIGAIYSHYYNSELIPRDGGEYTEALVGYPERINPVLAQTNDVDLDLCGLIFSGLFKYNEKQELVNDLVQNYEIDEEQKVYTFYLRHDAKWHDQEPLTADDVLFTVEAIQDVNYQSPLESSLRGVTAEKIDDYSFKLTLEDPFSPFLSGLTFGILPKHIWYDAYKVSASNILLKEENLKPIGSGPYRFESLTKDQDGNIKSYQLVRFDDYYYTKPHIATLNFDFFYDNYAALDALAKKQVDGYFPVPADAKEELLKKNKKLAIHELKLPQYTALFFNQDHSKVLAKDEVRQALVWGVDRNKIINEALKGQGIPVYTPILEGYIGHNSEVEKYGLNLEKGKQILEDKDWKIPEGEQYRKKGDQLLEFTIVTVDEPEYLTTLEILKQDWEVMGIKINVNTYAAQDITDQIIVDRNYEALLFGEITGTDPDPYAFWHSSQQEHPGLALSIFYQKDIDNLLETARETADKEQRRLKYFHFQNVLASEIPAIFLYQPIYNYAVDKKIQGINTQNIPLSSGRFSDITEWYIKSERVKKIQ